MKKVLSIIIFLAVIIPINSLMVDKQVITLEQETSVEFENYVGPYLFYNTVEEIRNIGAYLATKITTDLKSEGNYSNKYLMYHRPKLEWEKNINSCDIFEITSFALIDNIENIKLILSQYLIDTYGYTLEDSNLLAELLVMYNAVYRGDTEHLSQKYTSEGAIVDDPNNIGIDLHYYNWPGKTNMYIPLSDNILIGQLSNIDTDKILDDNVIDLITVELVDQIELREDIVDFKEREVDEEIKKIEDTKEKLLEEKSDIIELIKDDPENEALTNKLEDTKEKIDDLKVMEELIENKEDKILELRDDLAEDKNELIVKKDDVSTSTSVFPYILNRTDGDINFGTLLNITADGTIKTKGFVNSIRNNSYKSEGSYLYIIAGGDSENQIVTLGKLKQNDLTVVTWGNVECYDKSPIIFLGEKIYSTIIVDGKYYIGEFDSDLKLIRRTTDNLLKDSYIVLKDEVFYIQGEYNSIILVNLSDFIEITD
ncbi:MAG: hypothetical protein OCD02_20985 [Spirochaetaceae bacterium]